MEITGIPNPGPGWETGPGAFGKSTFVGTPDEDGNKYLSESRTRRPGSTFASYAPDVATRAGAVAQRRFCGSTFLLESGLAGPEARQMHTSTFEDSTSHVLPG